MKYNAWQIFKQGLKGNRGWTQAWQYAAPKASYDAVIIGANAHGLATACALAKNYGFRDIAVLDQGELSGGIAEFQEPIWHSQYMLPGLSKFYSHALKLWPKLSKELDFNLMASARGVLTLCHDAQEFDICARRGNVMMARGDDAVLMDRGMVQDLVPHLNCDDALYPVTGGLYQKEAGLADPDAVLWAYARAAYALGVDIICAPNISGLETSKGAIASLQTPEGKFSAKTVALTATQNASELAQLAGFSLPVERIQMERMITQAVKPFLNPVLRLNMGEVCVLQSADGRFSISGGKTRAQALNLVTSILPQLGQLRVQHARAGVANMTMDGAPIIDQTSIGGLFVNAGWGVQGFAAIPASGEALAHLIATGEPADFADAFRLDRFARGALLDEEGAGAKFFHA